MKQKAKRLLGFILVVVMISLMACNQNSSTSSTPAPAKPRPATVAPSTAGPKETSPALTSKPVAPEVTEALPEYIYIDVQKQSFVCEDSDGYQYEITVKITPWILQSNSELIQKAWDAVGNSRKELPSVSNMIAGVERFNQYYTASGQNEFLSVWPQILICIMLLAI